MKLNLEKAKKIAPIYLSLQRGNLAVLNPILFTLILLSFNPFSVDNVMRLSDGYKLVWCAGYLFSFLVFLYTTKVTVVMTSATENVLGSLASPEYFKHSANSLGVSLVDFELRAAMLHLASNEKPTKPADHSKSDK